MFSQRYYELYPVGNITFSVKNKTAIFIQKFINTLTICLPGISLFSTSHNHLLEEANELIQSLKAALKSFAKSFGKHWRWSVFFVKLQTYDFLTKKDSVMPDIFIAALLQKTRGVTAFSWVVQNWQLRYSTEASTAYQLLIFFKQPDEVFLL